MRNWRAVIKTIVANLDWFTAILLSLVFSILGIVGWFPPNVIFAATLLVLSILSISAIRDRFTLGEGKNAISELVKRHKLLTDASDTGISRVFSSSVNFDWSEYIQAANHVTIVSIKHHRFIWKGDKLREALQEVLKRGGTVTLVMADPRSPRLWLRFQEERTPKRTRSGEAEDLARVSYNLYEWKQLLIDEGYDCSKFLLLLFQNYPTQAFYKFDDKIFSYTYLYRELGYDAPMFLFTDPEKQAYKFFNRCIQNVIKDAIPLEEVIDDIRDKSKDHYFSDEQVLQSEIVADIKSKSKTK
jgi:hypothetical protein